MPERRPNILLLLTDQERQRSWIPRSQVLPHRQRLIDGGLEFTRYYTHSSPCSPSRATLLTGLAVSQHGVTENVNRPGRKELDPAEPTLGDMLREQGYYTAYVGKWHLSQTATPDMESFGFSDWRGDDNHFTGMAGTGLRFDPTIATQAVDWLKRHAQDERPWCLVVALVNPHDVMWFPGDQEVFQRSHPRETQEAKERLPKWMYVGEPMPAVPDDYDHIFERVPANFADDLTTKPTIQQQWLQEERKGLWRAIDPEDHANWIRKLDYYYWLHQEGDRNIGAILDALERAGSTDQTITIFTSDHGDMCGSHGLRSKGPFVYEEIMRVPLYIRAPGVTTAGAKSAALASHIDLAATIVHLAGGQPHPRMHGRDLTPVLVQPTSNGRECVLFAHDMPWYDSCIPLRYAIRGMFDGRFKYARYYGVGGAPKRSGEAWPTPKLVGVDAAFEEQEHELYDLQEDPHELVNLANDRGRSPTLRAWFNRLRALEREEFEGVNAGTRETAPMGDMTPAKRIE